MTNLKEKVLKYREDFKRSKLFFINNPMIRTNNYFGIFIDRIGNYHYDFSETTTEIMKYKR